MEHLIQYTWKVKTAFNDYLHRNLPVEDMIEQLRGVEHHYRNSIEAKCKFSKDERMNGGMWFKFFPEDTGATTIAELKKDLTYPSHPNYSYTRASMELSLGNNDELQIYFS